MHLSLGGASKAIMTLLRRVSHDSLHFVSIAETKSWVSLELSWNKRIVVMCTGYAVIVR